MCGAPRRPLEAAKLLDLGRATRVILLRRVLEYGGTPTIFDEITLPGPCFRGLTKAKYDAYHGSMYGFFETQFGVRMLKAQEKVARDRRRRNGRGAAPVAVGTPLLAVDRVTFTYGDRPVELRRGLCSTRQHYYANELQ
jgi:GntR family transcriptional regulator